jgi:hypothetical protein
MTGGTLYEFPLRQRTMELPLNCKKLLEEGESARVHVAVAWGRDRFGSTALELPWYADTIEGTVKLQPGIVHDLQIADFSFHAGFTCWEKGGKTKYDELTTFSETLPLPYWNASDPEDPLYLLTTDAESGFYRITSQSARLRWTALWCNAYQRIYIAGFDSDIDPPRVNRQIISSSEKITLILKDGGHLGPDEYVGGIVEAWYPQICGRKRLAQWWFEMNAVPGKRVPISPRSPYRYKPAPDAALEMWRAKGLEYHITAGIRSRKEEGGRGRIFDQTFVLDGPKIFHIAVP